MKNTRSSVRSVGPSVVLASFVLILSSSLAAPAQTWVATATQAVGPALTNAISQGLLPDSTPIHVNVGLQIQNRAALVSYVQRINTLGIHCTLRNLNPQASLPATHLRTRRCRPWWAT